MSTSILPAIDTLPATARIWIYQADRQLSQEEVDSIKADGRQFLNGWAAHGSAMTAAMEVLHQRFLVLCADETVMKASGCSIDSSVHFIQGLGSRLDVDFFDRMTICYLHGDEVGSCSMMEIKTLLASGELAGETLVFDNLVATRADFSARWLAPLESTWMSRYL